MQQDNFDYEEKFRDVDRRLQYLEKVISELKYLAQCKGWKFDHIDKEQQCN